MWVYHIPTGILVDPNGVRQAQGYSGHPPHVNDASAIGLVAVGPCPPGSYTLDPPQDSPKTGPYTLTLIPDAATNAFIASLGRDPESFRVHGDLVGHVGEQLASDGCLIFPLAVRTEMWESTDHAVSVVATA